MSVAGEGNVEPGAEWLLTREAWMGKVVYVILSAGQRHTNVAFY